MVWQYIKKFSSKVSLSKCLVYYFKIRGVAPIQMKIEPINNGTQRCFFATSWISVTYSLLMCFGILVWSYTTDYVHLIKNTNTGTLNLVLFHFFNVGTALIVLYFCINQHKSVKLLNEIINARNAIYDSNSNLERALQKRLIKKFMILSALSIFIASENYVSFYYSSLNDPVSATKAYFVWIMPDINILQYSLVLILILHPFVIMNENYSETQRNHNNSIAVIPRPSDFDSQLYQYWDSYSMLNGVIHALSNFYSFPILLSVFSKMVQIIYLAYFLAIFDFTKEIGIAIIMLWELAKDLYFLLVLTTSVTAILDQDEKTRKIVNNYWKNRNLHQAGLDTISRFSMYLLHSRLTISIYNICSLGNSLIVKIIGTLMTYIVILLQFRPSDMMQHDNSTRALPLAGNFTTP